ncbi:MAG: photosynthetic reaction center subunit H [Pseudomonadota bacterium]
MEGIIVGRIDLALVSLYLFWLFFAGLVYWLQRENMREGYPLEDEQGNPVGAQGLFPLPDPKTFKLPHGRGEVSVPNGKGDSRELAMELTSPSGGSPFTPTGDPLVDGIGPAAWAERRDLPELDGHGHPKIVPMRMSENFQISAGRDPRGLPVAAYDGDVVGKINDLWIDEPEQLVRYLEIELNDGTACLLPMPLARIRKYGVRVHSLHGKHFANIPRTRSPNQVTMLEEEKICAYYCGGKLYANEERLEPQV